VLQTGGTISPGFRWSDPARTEDPREYLESEGLEFDDDHAHPDQFIDAQELATLVGLDVNDDGPAWQTSGPRPLLAQRKEFFQTVRDLGEATATTIASWPNASTEYALDVSLGIPGVLILLSLSSREPTAVSCSFYIRHDKGLYARLLAHREEIETAVGATLEWRDIPENKSSQVILRHDGDWRDDAQAPQIAQWLVSTADKFAEVFPRYL
jgi:hypothetical protein